MLTDHFRGLFQSVDWLVTFTSRHPPKLVVLPQFFLELFALEVGEVTVSSTASQCDVDNVLRRILGLRGKLR
jgi:hypothetical protein